ncbi:MAG TPA: hypothetical protein VNH64_09730 [Parvularculaceae bacterium]|nr:hypothetical protein [Parvularculaceae bacterium]
MRLRRIMEHVRTLNWVAVAVDFIIVVAGVFIAMQVSNWNGARVENKRAAEFKQRLLGDLRGEDKVLEATIDYYRQVSASAETTLNALMMRQASSNEALLISAYRASQYAWAPNLRATFDELVATGDLSLIHDAKLRDIAVAFYTGEAFEISDVEGRQSRYREAFRMTIAPETYRAITKACGDRPDAANGANISYVCKLDLPQADIDDAAEALRANKELSALLRLRIAELDNELDSFVTVKDFLESSLGDYEKSARRRSD